MHFILPGITYFWTCIALYTDTLDWYTVSGVVKNRMVNGTFFIYFETDWNFVKLDNRQLLILTPLVVKQFLKCCQLPLALPLHIM